jgi:hypothetical protein
MGLIWCSAFLLGVAVFAPLESLVLCVDYYNASFPVRTLANFASDAQQLACYL